MKFKNSSAYFLHSFPRERGKVGMGAGMYHSIGGETKDSRLVPAPTLALPRFRRGGNNSLNLCRSFNSRGRDKNLLIYTLQLLPQHIHLIAQRRRLLKL